MRNRMFRTKKSKALPRWQKNEKNATHITRLPVKRKVLRTRLATNNIGARPRLTRGRRGILQKDVVRHLACVGVARWR